MVDQALIALGREEAERNPEDEREEAGGDRKLDRGGEPTLELLDDRLTRLGRFTEVAPRGCFQIPPVLHGQRFVEPILPVDLRYRLRRCPLAEQGDRRAAR